MQFTWVSLILLLSVYGMIRFLFPASTVEGEKIPWRPLETIGITFFIFFFSQLFGGLTIYSILSVFGLSEDKISNILTENPLGQFVGTLIIQGLMVLLLTLFLKRRKRSLKDIGLYGHPAWRDVGSVLLAYLGYIIVFIVVAALVEKLVPAVDVDQKQDIGYENIKNIHLPLVFISLVVLPPIVEEIMMRGFLYSGLKQKLPKISAVLLTSLLFAVAHLQFGGSAPLLWIAAIDTFLLSLFLIHLRDKTGKLWAPIMLHALKNGVVFVNLFIFQLA